MDHGLGFFNRDVDGYDDYLNTWRVDLVVSDSVGRFRFACGPLLLIFWCLETMTW